MRCIPSLLLGLFSVSSLLSQDTSVVVTAGKSWSANGKSLARGQTITPSVELSQEGTEPSDLILDCGKAGWLSYTCGKLPCTVRACQAKTENVSVLRVDLAAGSGEPSETSADWFASLFKLEPQSLEVLGVRAGGNVTEAVLRETGSDVHLGPALGRVLEGTYCFRFTPLRRGSNSATEATLKWDRDADFEGLVSLPGLHPGLYAVEKSSSEAAGACTFEHEANPAWVFIASASDFPGLASQWKRYAVQLNEMSKDGATPGVLLTVRHAALSHFAESVP
jgi:hypothetical protein